MMCRAEFYRFIVWTMMAGTAALILVMLVW